MLQVRYGYRGTKKGYHVFIRSLIFLIPYSTKQVCKYVMM
jgi:hypothetical protein